MKQTLLCLLPIDPSESEIDMIPISNTYSPAGIVSGLLRAGLDLKGRLLYVASVVDGMTVTFGVNES